MKLSDSVKVAKQEVEDAIDALNKVPMNYGGHLVKECTSVIDGLRAMDAIIEEYEVMAVAARYSRPE